MIIDLVILAGSFDGHDGTIFSIMWYGLQCPHDGSITQFLTVEQTISLLFVRLITLR